MRIPCNVTEKVAVFAYKLSVLGDATLVSELRRHVRRHALDFVAAWEKL